MVKLLYKFKLIIIPIKLQKLWVVVQNAMHKNKESPWKGNVRIFYPNNPIFQKKIQNIQLWRGDVRLIGAYFLN